MQEHRNHQQPTAAPGGRAAQLNAVNQGTRTLVTRLGMLDQAIAAQLGIGMTDLQCLGVIDLTGPLTAGRLAQVTGLTTGAVTGVVDRLERAGFVRRVPDPADRRRVIVEPVGDRPADVAAAYAPLRRELAAWAADRTDAELALVADFLRTVGDALPELTAQVRAETAGRGARRSAPRRGR